MLNLVDAFNTPNCGKLPQEHGSLYNKIFAPYVNKKIRMLEIGVWQGISLKIWKKFFTDVELFGIDVQLRNSEILEYAKVVFGDQSYVPFMKKVANELGPFDIVIDDGGHYSDDQQVSFNALWPVVNSGGLYVIEDLWVAKDRAVNGYECTLDFLDKLDVKKEYYKGFDGFEKDICVLYKE